MVILVRCSNGSYSLALESRLEALINDGLVAAFLKDGEWITAGLMYAKRDTPTVKIPQGRFAAHASPF
jgi:hypothetical protein